MLVTALSDVPWFERGVPCILCVVAPAVNRPSKPRHFSRACTSVSTRFGVGGHASGHSSLFITRVDELCLEPDGERNSWVNGSICEPADYRPPRIVNAPGLQQPRNSLMTWVPPPPARFCVISPCPRVMSLPPLEPLLQREADGGNYREAELTRHCAPSHQSSSKPPDDQQLHTKVPSFDLPLPQ